MKITNRIEVVDALRGFAILGILLLHSIEHFNFSVYPPAETQSEFMQLLNQYTSDTLFGVFGSKAYGIFSLLFGFTFYVQFSRMAKENKDFGGRFAWRMLILLGIGLINSILFPGEILLVYAVLSPTLLLIRNWSDKQVLFFAVFFLLQPLEIFQMVRTLIDPAYTLPNYKVGYFWNETTNYLKEGSLLSMITNAYKGVLMTFGWSMGNGRILQNIGLFALGYYFGKKELFVMKAESAKTWKVIFIVSVVLFVCLMFSLSVAGSFEGQQRKAFRILFSAWKNLSQIFLMVSLFVLLFRWSVFQRLVKPLLAYGRMSLSNYLMQSVVGGLLYYPYGLYLANRLNMFYSLILGFFCLFLFVWFCNWWIGKYRQGPLEKIWHKLTWINVDDFWQKAVARVKSN